MSWPDVQTQLIAYAYAIFAGHYLIKGLNHTLWQQLGEHRTKEGLLYEWPDEHTAIVGMLERALYLTSWQLGKPEFIAVWVALKVAGQWKGWAEDWPPQEFRVVAGRAVFNVFLIGTGLSIGYGVVGGLIVQWGSSGRGLEACVAGVALALSNVIICFWMEIVEIRKRRHELNRPFQKRPLT